MARKTAEPDLTAYQLALDIIRTHTRSDADVLMKVREFVRGYLPGRSHRRAAHRILTDFTAWHAEPGDSPEITAHYVEVALKLDVSGQRRYEVVAPDDMPDEELGRLLVQAGRSFLAQCPDASV